MKVKKLYDFINENSKNDEVKNIKDSFLELEDDYGYSITIEYGHYTTYKHDNSREFSSSFPNDTEYYKESFVAYQVQVEFIDNKFNSIDESPFVIIPNFIKNKHFDYIVEIKFRTTTSNDKCTCYIVLVDTNNELNFSTVAIINSLTEKIKSIIYDKKLNFMSIDGEFPINFWTYFSVYKEKVRINMVKDHFVDGYDTTSYHKDVSKICQLYNKENKDHIEYKIIDTDELLIAEFEKK